MSEAHEVPEPHDSVESAPEQHADQKDDENGTELTDASGADTPDDAFEGFDFQVAIDALTTGASDQPIINYLARQMGVDPANYSLRKRPFTLDKLEQDGKLRYMGEVESLDHDADLNTDPPRQVKVAFQEATEPLKYDTLDATKKQIRLLRYAPPSADDVVESFQLDTVSLDEAPTYQCLSYVWGNPERFAPIVVNGKKLMITGSLYCCIGRCFTRFPDTRLWADGICIDQDNLQERAQQVSLMSQIYSRAQRVIAIPGAYGRLSDTTASKTSREAESSESSSSSSSSDSSLDGEQTNSASQHEEVHYVVTEQEGGQNAFSLMNYLSRVWNLGSDFETLQESEWDKYKLPDANKDNFEIWESLLEFWTEEWFNRAWVLQEVVLPSSVIVMYRGAFSSLDSITKFWERAQRRDAPRILRSGPLADAYARFLNLSQIGTFKKLRDFRHKTKAIPTNDEDSPEGAETINRSNNTDRSHTVGAAEDGSSLLDLLAASRANLATDLRDKVYGLLGLAHTNDKVAKLIKPNYSSDNSPARVYFQVAEAYIKSGMGVQLLQHAGIDRKLQSLPSWVPDWSHQSRSTFIIQLYNCIPNSVASISFARAPGKLKVRGAIIDSVQFVSLAWQYYSHNSSQHPFAAYLGVADGHGLPRLSDEEGRQVIHAIATRVAVRHYSEALYPEGVDSVLARTITADCTWQRQRTRGDPSLVDSYRAFWSLYEPQDNPPEGVSGEKWAQTHRYGGPFLGWLKPFDEAELARLRKLSWPYESAMQAVQKGRRFCITEDGYMCTATHDTEKEDIVAVLEGFPMPFVLRPCENGEDYEVVGNCYVHSIMDGELVSAADGLALEESQISVDVAGKNYALKLNEGYARFQDFSLV